MSVSVGELTGSVTLSYVLVVELSRSTSLVHGILRDKTDNVHAQEYVLAVPQGPAMREY